MLFSSTPPKDGDDESDSAAELRSQPKGKRKGNGKGKRAGREEERQSQREDTSVEGPFDPIPATPQPSQQFNLSLPTLARRHTNHYRTALGGSALDGSEHDGSNTPVPGSSLDPRAAAWETAGIPAGRKSSRLAQRYLTQSQLLAEDDDGTEEDDEMNDDDEMEVDPHSFEVRENRYIIEDGGDDSDRDFDFEPNDNDNPHDTSNNDHISNYEPSEDDMPRNHNLHHASDDNIGDATTMEDYDALGGARLVDDDDDDEATESSEDGNPDSEDDFDSPEESCVDSARMASDEAEIAHLVDPRYLPEMTEDDINESSFLLKKVSTLITHFRYEPCLKSHPRPDV